ncbi:phosphatidylserine decarboxylase family protein [Flavivirga jejuensis]|uniref:Phophatidylserine decarboxylase associated domain-containing protein n=1 Tax=Flavivirga jejuensis TaxID=870487 RepID=A0ABT8WLH5_9FLAO|nr:phosphatidylserine decarboxylase family protein [Flavivirga jejuensis]MDO5973995.1 phophatidylserine decarboxylase associated domain-containing protein [Flavivirga jejuensis]
METTRERKHQFNVGRWLPADYELIRNHIKGIKSYVASNPTSLTPNIVALNAYVTGNPTINTWSNDMFTEVPAKYKNSIYGTELQSWSEFIPLLNGIMTMTQTFNESGCVGFPINSLLDWAMGTNSGHKFFLDNGVNEHFNKVLNDWGAYLKSTPSKSAVLNSNALVTGYPGHFSDNQYYWLSDKAMISMANALNDGTNYDGKPTEARTAFIAAFQCPNINDPHYGFTSWDDFFTRKFKPGVRPIATGEHVISNACESGPYRVAYNVKKLEKFWVKGQPYSLKNIFNETNGNTPLTDKYEGGTIYQAFLSAESFHRWHSPVDGTVKTVYDTVSQTPFNSTYYSEMLPLDPLNEDDAGPNESQAYISNVATRAIIEITAHNPAIGDMCVIPIGMAECATCEVTVSVSDLVTKGKEIGMFHFGGSTHLLVFQKNVSLLFDYHGQHPSLNTSNIPVNSKIATVVKKTIPYPTESGTSSLCIGNTSTINKNASAILSVVPSTSSAYPINVGNSKGEYLWGVDASGNINTTKGTPQISNPGASCNLHINFPDTGSNGYVIGDNPNNDICAALKIVVPSSTSANWPLVIADETGKTIWAIDCDGKKNTSTPVPSKVKTILNMPYPSTEGGSNGFTIGDVAKTTGCYGGISIILPEGSTSRDVYAIAIVDAMGKLLWGVNGSGIEVTS